MLISEKIFLIRDNLALSQSKFAELLGFSQGYIGDIESGRTKPSKKLIETISKKCEIHIDWLTSNDELIDIIYENQLMGIHAIIYVFAFTEEGIDIAEKELNNLLSDRALLQIDAYGIGTTNKFMRKLLNAEGSTDYLLDILKSRLLEQELVLIIKNMSKSKIRNSGGLVKTFFNFVNNPHIRVGPPGSLLTKKMTKSSIVLIDYPSYLEKNMNSFGYYANPIQAIHGRIGPVK